VKIKYLLTMAAIVAAMVLKPIFSFSQNQAKIGQQVPNFKISNVVNSDKSEFNMDDFKGKLIILDFGNIHCSSCIRALPRYDTLQKIFGDKIKFIWVTIDSKDSLKNFFKNNKLGMLANNIAAISNDQILTKYFNHVFIPHEVWIDSKGIVRASTSDHYVDSLHISEMLNGTNRRWPVKSEEDFNLNDGFSSLNYKNLQNIPIPKFFFCSAFTSHIENGFMTGNCLTTDTVNHTTTIHYMNASIKKMYSWTLGLKKIPSDIKLRENSHFITKVNDIGLIDFGGNGYKEDWEELHTFCYEIRFPQNKSIEVVRKRIFQDLDYYFSLKSSIVDTTINCWKIVRLTIQIKSPSQGAKNGYTIPDFVEGLNAANGTPPVIMQEHLTAQQLAEKHFLTNEESETIYNHPNFNVIKSMFNQMGLDLVKSKYKTKVFVLMDAK